MIDDKSQKEFAAKFAAINEQWKGIHDHPFYNHAGYFKHKVLWGDIEITKVMIVWLIENCNDKFSIDMMEQPKQFCNWNDKIHISFINKDDAIHFRMVWI